MIGKMNRSYKVLLLGNGGVGKTTYLNRYVGRDFNPRYLSTEGISVMDTIEYNGRTISIYELPGQEKYGNHHDHVYEGADAAIIMFDVGSRLTMNGIFHWENKVRTLCGDIPIEVVGNKYDIREHKHCSVEHHKVSSKNRSSMNAPIDAIITKL